jgi:hypothetical protein
MIVYVIGFSDDQLGYLFVLELYSSPESIIKAWLQLSFCIMVCFMFVILADRRKGYSYFIYRNYECMKFCPDI